ncbi:MAG: 50S ribosomal protein L1 [Candidatus Omnitrophica bacterium]|nr:50S ribosomal protein L1 [Candidatus Omnitrophota bacterium]
MGKRIKEANKLVDKNKAYKLIEAISILKQTPAPKFDESIDLSIKLNIDPKETSQPVRGSVVLPHGTGKKVRVAVFCKGEHESKAKEAGADIVGSDELIDKVSNGFLDFDVCVATPDMMKEMGKLGRVLGPRGLMPSPKAGTVTNDVAKAIDEVKAGKVEFRMDKLACINMTVGKRSFSEDFISQNATSIINAVIQSRPPQVKGRFFKSISISTTMGPGIRLDAASF